LFNVTVENKQCSSGNPYYSISFVIQAQDLVPSSPTR